MSGGQVFITMYIKAKIIGEVLEKRDQKTYA